MTNPATDGPRLVPFGEVPFGEVPFGEVPVIAFSQALGDLARIAGKEAGVEAE